MLNETISGNVADEFGPTDYPRLRYIRHSPMDSYVPFQSDLKSSIEFDSFFSNSKNYYNLETTRVKRDKDYYLKDIDEDVGNGNPINIKKMNVNISQKNPAQPKTEKFEYTDFSRVKNTILLKNNFLSNLYSFISIYVNDINNIFTKLNDILFKKITNTIEQYKNFLKFFKEIIESYQKMSVEMLKINNNISGAVSENPLFEKINNIFEKTQTSISENLSEFSNNLNNNLLINGPFYKIKDLYVKMGNISKEINTNLGEINFKRDRLIAKHNNNLKIFENFKNNYNDYEKTLSVLKKSDFFTIEFSFLKSFNKLIDKINIFLDNYKTQLKSLIGLITDFTVFLKESIQIYYSENNKIFTHYLEFQKVEKLFDTISVDQVEEMFKPEILFDDLVTNFEESLTSFQLNILKFSFVKKDEVYQDEHFKLSHYSNLQEFLSFITLISPSEITYDNSTLLTHCWEVKRDPGFFKSWKVCYLVITIQNNIFIFDDKIQNRFIDKLDFKSSSFSGKEDKKNPFRFDITEIKKGFIYNSNSTYYFDAGSQENFDSIVKVFDPKIINKTVISK